MSASIPSPRPQDRDRKPEANDRHPDRGKSRRPSGYDKQVEATFPASDPPAASEPGGGITGPDDDRPKR